MLKGEILYPRVASHLREAILWLRDNNKLAFIGRSGKIVAGGVYTRIPAEIFLMLVQEGYLEKGPGKNLRLTDKDAPKED